MSLFDFSYEFPNTIDEIDKFTGKEFEVFLFEFFKVLDYHPRLTDDSNDKGIDLTIKLPELNGHKNIGIQAKRWKGKVGPTEIRTMLDGKNHYNLDEVWIITTSDLTSAAITTAKNNDIQILNRDNVIKFLEEIKKHDVKFKKIEHKNKKQIINSSKYSNEIIEGLKEFRKMISKKYKLYPVYTVFNNSEMYQLLDEKPKNIEELYKISGFGIKKIDTFGKELIEYLQDNLIYEKKDDQTINLYNLLVVERQKIAKYNHLDEKEVYSDEVAMLLAETKPQNPDKLKEIDGFKKENIEIFGKYLIKIIVKYIN